MNKKQTFGWIDALLIVALLGCLCITLCPYAPMRSFADSLAADGSMERMTPAFALGLRVISGGFAALFLAILIWHRLAPAECGAFFTSLIRLPGRLIRDFIPFWRDFGRSWRLSKSSAAVLLGITLAGVIVRAMQVGSPLMHDEAYSMAIWGRGSLLFAVSDYHLPNNHVFHSVLVNLIYHHLGRSAAWLRMPVFLSGCLLIPAVFMLGKAFYNERVGLTAAGFTAFAPFLILYSYNARGYEMLTLLSVWTVTLALYVKRNNNIFAWFMLILLSGLSFFTLPIALYPFGGICVWLLLNVILYNPAHTAYSRGRLFKYLITMGLCVSALSILLYLPLLRYSGVESFFGNQYIGGVDAGAFGVTMVSRLADNLYAFCDTLPNFVCIFIGIGLVISPFVFRRTSSERVSFGAALLLWMVLVIPLQKPNLWPRTLLFLHPFVILWASNGLLSVLGLLRIRRIESVVVGLLILWAGIWQFIAAGDNCGVVGEDEQAVRILLEREGENVNNVHFVTAAQDNAPIWMYADFYGIDKGIFDKTRTFNTVYAFVNPNTDSYNAPLTLGDLLDRFGPGNNFIDKATEEILMERPDGILYRYEGRESAVVKGYGSFPANPNRREP